MAIEFSYPLVICIAAILVMTYCLWTTVRFRKQVPGGIVGEKWKIMSWLVTLFLFGYLTTPFFGVLPDEVLRFIVSLIFFFGAVYVLITIRLIHAIIRELTE